ncbi:MAG: hypothetical protein F2903_06255 [Actinobacteria bacterium]|uniref:Unannotated protein n=1 Tax=freshwater metagenome TaxID=449393 RepID=A0A6J7RCG8_9ZZZZ|nr:hypothetical protein [Actinomycetota bacterium]MSX09138.1 hypothetical protein [Actinomycetota bacterium]
MKATEPRRRHHLLGLVLLVIVALAITVPLLATRGAPSHESATSPSTASNSSSSSTTPTTLSQGNTSSSSMSKTEIQKIIPAGEVQKSAKAKIIFPTKEAWNNGVRNSSAQNAGAATAASPQPLTYQGGNLGIGVTTGPPKVYVVFWGSQWGAQSTNAEGNAAFSGDAKGVAPKLQAMLKGFGTNNETWSNVMTQYCELVPTGSASCPVSNGSHVGYPAGGALAGVWYDNSTTAPSNATGFSLLLEAVTAAGHFGNTTPLANRNAQYVIVSPSGTHPDGFNAGAGFCAWHSDTNTYGYGPIAFTNLPYIPDMGASCGSGYVNGSFTGQLDGLTMVASHEYAETITDQLPVGGWVDSSYEENGDKCSWVGVGGATGAQNIALSTGSFALQSTWSNLSMSCAVTGASFSNQNVISLTTPPGQSATVQTPFRLQLSATDSGSSPITYRSTGLPSGLTLDFASGLISGTPTASGVYPIALSVTDDTGITANATFTITVRNAIAVITPPIQNVLIQTPFSLQISASDNGGVQMAYAATGLPNGLSIGASSGLISGTPTTSGSSTVGVSVSDASGASVTVSFSMTVQVPFNPGPPSVPLNVRASTTANQISVFWNPPSLGSPVLSYRVTASPGGSFCITASTSCVVRGLSPGTRYQVTLSSSSSEGAGVMASLFVTTDQFSSLGVGQSLAINQEVTSPDGRFATVMQSDGNLVTYGPGGARWNTGTSGKGGVLVVFQGDGNIVMYTSSWKAVWASWSRSSHAGLLVLQNDGNFVGYNSMAQPVWSSFTGPLSEPAFAVPPEARTAIGPGAQLAPGQAMFSSNGAYMAIMQGDGNFVIYSGGGAVWSSGTSGHPGSSLIFQSDGNIVVYSPTRVALWATWSMGAYPPSALVLQGDGNLVEYNIWAFPMWASRR